MKQPVIDGRLEYTKDGVSREMGFGPSTTEVSHGIRLTASFRKTKAGLRFDCQLDTDSEIVIQKLSLKTDLIDSKEDRVLLNGYQSWTDTKEFSRHDRMTGPSKLFAPLLEKHRVTRYADYEFQEYSRQRGILHGASYGYVRPALESGISPSVRFFGSLDENTGFTFFHVNLNEPSMDVRKDCGNLTVTGTYRAFSLFFAEGTEDDVMDGWFAEMKIKALKAKPCTGWTSWYNYYQNISEYIILDNLRAFSDRKLPIDIFQIDDGYQTAVGDWLSVNERFPHGMRAIASKIKAAGFTAGIWLAPFAAETTSRLFIEHPSWFVTGDDGKPYSTGGNWSGFYSLDLYNREARDYVRRVFDVILNEWGFDLVKLDFLYGVCIKSRSDKTRGQIMGEAMDFLRECVGKKQILGCGVPLWSAFGKVEYCRIGTDIDLQWHNRLYGALIHREFPSTRYAVQNTVFRRHLDGRAFVNDPDVFLLRRNNLALSDSQKKIVFFANFIFGNLLFTSDNIREYGEEEMSLYLSSFPLTEKKIGPVTFDREVYTARFSIGTLEYFLVSNNGPAVARVKLPDAPCFRSGSRCAEWLEGGTRLAIPPYTAECYLLCATEGNASVIGSTVSAFPGSEAISVSIRGDKLSVKLRCGVQGDGNLFIGLSGGRSFVMVGKTKLPVMRGQGRGFTLNYVAVPIGLLL